MEWNDIRDNCKSCHFAFGCVASALSIGVSHIYKKKGEKLMAHSIYHVCQRNVFNLLQTFK